MKNLGTMYKELSAEERAVYERKADKLKEEYKQMKTNYGYVLI